MPSVVKDMAITHRDVARLITRIHADITDLDGDGTRLRVPWTPGYVIIALGPEIEQRLGNILLMRTRVELIPDGLGREEMERFVQRFDRVFQRGGG